MGKRGHTSASTTSNSSDRPRRSRRWTAGIAASAVAMLMGCGGKGDKSSASPTPDTARAESEAAPQAGTNIPQLVKDGSESVVAITVRTQNGAGEGSGVIWNHHGHLVTNNHVVEGASTVEVQNAQGEQFRGRVVAADARTDLAVVQVDGGDLPAATFSHRLPEVGALALASGSPLGFENMVTAGIVSGLDRSLPTGAMSRRWWGSSRRMRPSRPATPAARWWARTAR
jgi:serine protease DegQ